MKDSLTWLFYCLPDSTDQHHQEVKELEEVKESLGRQLKTLQEVLDNQIEKYKEQVRVFLIISRITNISKFGGQHFSSPESKTHR